MRVTIKDVVKASGLSYATVSKAIRKDPSVKQKNIDLVQATMKAIGYVPSAAARTLVTGKTNVIALLVSDLGDGFYDAIIKEVNTTLHSKGYLLTLAFCDDEDAHMSFIAQDRVDGVILMVPHREQEFGSILKKRQVPYVVLDQQTIDHQIHSLSTDNVLGGYLAVQHLLDCGAPSIGIIGGVPEGIASIDRYKGAKKALIENNLQPYVEAFGDFSQSTGYEAIMNWHSISLLPKGIFAFDDNIAVGAVNALKDLGLSVPKDVMVCGYDDSELSSCYTPSITTIRQPVTAIASLAVEKLLNQIEGLKIEDESIKLPPELVIKGSTNQQMF